MDRTELEKEAREFAEKRTKGIESNSTLAAQLADFALTYANRLEVAKAALGRLPKEVPTNWLDPLLTGPEAVLPKGSYSYDGRHIEKILQGVQDRLLKVAREALSQIEHRNLD